MGSFVLFTIVCVCAISSIGLTNGYRRFENEIPHRGRQTDCRGTRMKLNHHMMELKCMPRKTLVKLKPEVGYAYMPNVVSVKRCGGFCMNNLSCMPVESVTREILVRRQHIESRELPCYTVHVEEHTLCKCDCNVMEEDCNSSQVYMEDDCACKCTEDAEMMQCGDGMIWNSETCSCNCIKREEECSTGLAWIPSMCRCGMIMLT